MRSELAPLGIQLIFVETKLSQEELDQSNTILFNGVPLEHLLEGAVASKSTCQSCSCLIGTNASCRTVEYDDHSYEEIPEALIRQAAYAALKSGGI